MTPITGKTVFHAPCFARFEAAGLPLLVVPEDPTWAAVEPRGVEILEQADGRTPASRA